MKARQKMTKILLELISPIFYEQFFSAKCFAKLICWQFGFVIFWWKEIGAKTAHKMLMKLASGADAMNISGLLV
jgi:hypothetical protein